MKSHPARLMSSRFSDDCNLLKDLQTDQEIVLKLKQLNSAHYKNVIRSRLLSSAVRVDARLVPGIANSFKKIQRMAGIDKPMEAYVYEDSSINACVTQGRSYTIVALSSGAINSLAEHE